MLIYVAVGDGGLVKVGRTVMLDKKYLLRPRFTALGENFVEMEMFPSSNNVDDERALIKVMHNLGRVVHGREWFRGVSYEDAKREASKIAISLRDARLVARLMP